MAADPWAEFQDAAVADFKDNGWDQFADAPLPALKVSRAEMRNAFLPGYADTRKRLAKDQQFAKAARIKVAGQKVGNVLNGIEDWQTQVARNTGAFDEVAGGITYLTQGAENLGRRVMGQPVTTPAKNAAQAATDYEREQQAQYKQEHPVGNAFASAASIAATARPTGGAMITNPFLAGATVAAQNLPFAVARQEGDLGERLPGAALESGLAFGTGAALTAAGNAFARRAAARAAAPRSNARQLADMDMILTPGQMGGRIGRRIEDTLESAPLTGAGIKSAKTRGLQSFDVTAINQALDPIGEQIGANAGRGAVREASQRVSAAYNRALNGVQVTPDAQYAAEIQAVLATPNLPAAIRQDLQDIVATSVNGRMGAGVDGRTWKAIDEELGAMARAADNASGTQPTQRYLARALEAVQDAHSNLLARVSPEAAQGVSRADAAFANMTRINNAASGVGTAGREGIFTPADLNRAVATGGGRAGRRQYAQQTALMQDVSEPAMAVLPQSVPDSGTATRLLLTGGAYGGGFAGLTAAGAGEWALAGMGADALGMAVYSRPVQAAINAVYRANGPGQMTARLAAVQRLAARDPALVPVYRRLVEQAAPLLERDARPQSTQQRRQAATTP